ncbi:thyrotropin-releasing hormone receptor [Cydia fagiglandana]|uniref:thyrotropin-releasing hormone receptor n=1 Tax=Cydia fagiglandana TaxID=1458189 RepID=UPI002FEDF1FB
MSDLSPRFEGADLFNYSTAADSNYSTYVNETFFDFIAHQVASALNVYYTPLLVSLGTIGNLVSVYVFYSSKLRLQSTSQYLSALAISDTVFLFQLMMPWLGAVKLTGLFYTQGFCQIFIYFSYVTCDLSAWLVVAFTVERFVAVLYPLRRNAICTVARARHIISTIVASALLLNVPVLRFAAPVNNDCSIDVQYLVHAARFNLLDTAVSFTVPLGVIIVLNVWIMVGVYRLERTRHHLMKTEQPGPVPGQRTRPSRLQQCPRSQQRVTRMLLIVSSVFVVLNMPAYTMRVVAYAYNMSLDEYNGRYAAVTQLANMFFNTNFGINFILYCLSGQNFRRALRQTIPWLRNRARRGVAVRRATSFHPARASSVSTSYVSNFTEATSNYGVSSVTPGVRRRRRDTFITRWTFDNSRRRAPAPELEMKVFTPNYTTT